MGVDLVPLEFVVHDDMNAELRSSHGRVLGNHSFLEEFARALSSNGLLDTHGLILLSHRKHLGGGSLVEQSQGNSSRRLIATPTTLTKTARIENERLREVIFRFSVDGSPQDPLYC